MVRRDESERPKRLAFIVGISEYDSLPELTACVNDVHRVRELLDATGRYSSVVMLERRVSAPELKDRFREFAKLHGQDKDVEEVFFYFSGHGHSEGNLVGSDFSEDALATTSLSNKEVDDLIRTIQPRLTVKVLDACHSGTRYVKSPDSFLKAASKIEFGDFYCFASCRESQKSIATNSESIFTKAFLDGAIRKKEGDVYYRDIEAHIADEFSREDEQTPFFVKQGSGLEVFTTQTNSIAELRSRADLPTNAAADMPKKVMPQSLAVIVASRDAEHVRAEEVDELLLMSWQSLQEHQVEGSDFGRYFSLDCTKRSLDDIPAARKLGEKARSGKWRTRYFVDILYEEYFEKVADTSVLAFMRQVGGHPATRTVKRKRPVGICSTHSASLEAIELIVRSPEHPSLPQYGAWVALVLSGTSLVTATTTVSYNRVGWGEWEIESGSVSWRLSDRKWTEVREDPSAIWSGAVREVEEMAQEHLRSLIPPAAEDSADAGPPRDGAGVDVIDSTEGDEDPVAPS